MVHLVTFKLRTSAKSTGSGWGKPGYAWVISPFHSCSLSTYYADKTVFSIKSLCFQMSQYTIREMEIVSKHTSKP